MQDVIMEKKYEKIIERVKEIKKEFIHQELSSGEQFNVFNILGLSANELSHSRMLADFLNVKGTHGQGDIYLKLFIEQLNLPAENNFHEDSPNWKVIKNFKTKQSEVCIEKHVGNIDYEQGTGGRIDILLTDGQEFIIIENKIYAADQSQQLLRYKNFQLTKDTPILYLTLDGSDANIQSKSNNQESLNEKIDYIRISYRFFIKEWIEKCIHHSEQHPSICEIFKQYLNIIKKLTNQTINDKMSKELASYLSSNYEEFDSIIKVKNDVYSLIIEKFKSSIESICEEKELQLEFYMNPGINYSGFKIVSSQLRSQNLQVCFEFQGSSAFSLGFVWLNKKESNDNFKKRLQELFIAEFSKFEESDSWPAYTLFNECPYWNQFYLLTWNGELEVLIEEKVNQLIEISNQLNFE